MSNPASFDVKSVRHDWYPTGSTKGETPMLSAVADIGMQYIVHCPTLLQTTQNLESCEVSFEVYFLSVKTVPAGSYSSTTGREYHYYFGRGIHSSSGIIGAFCAFIHVLAMHNK
jgi:hypothetical protein